MNVNFDVISMLPHTAARCNADIVNDVLESLNLGPSDNEEGLHTDLEKGESNNTLADKINRDFDMLTSDHSQQSFALEKEANVYGMNRNKILAKLNKKG